MAKGLTLAAIKSNVTKVSIDLAQYGFEGVEPLEVVFRTNFWTKKAQEACIPTDGKAASTDAQVICDAGATWNLTDDGKPIPMTTAVLTEVLPNALVGAIVTAMLEAVDPNPKTSEG